MLGTGFILSTFGWHRHPLEDPPAGPAGTGGKNAIRKTGRTSTKLGVLGGEARGPGWRWVTRWRRGAVQSGKENGPVMKYFGFW